jgi:hypothetical protein
MLLPDREQAHSHSGFMLINRFFTALLQSQQKDQDTARALRSP